MKSHFNASFLEPINLDIGVSFFFWMVKNGFVSLYRIFTNLGGCWMLDVALFV